MCLSSNYRWVTTEAQIEDIIEGINEEKVKYNEWQKMMKDQVKSGYVITVMVIAITITMVHQENINKAKRYRPYDQCDHKYRNNISGQARGHCYACRAAFLGLVYGH